MILPYEDKTTKDYDYKSGFVSINNEFVYECDRTFEKELAGAVEKICFGKGARIIGLTGPTCSGKTTAANCLISVLQRHNTGVCVISLDDFYKIQSQRANINLAQIEQIDFDSPETIDSELLSSFTEQLFRQGRAEMPIYDFGSGQRLKSRIVEIHDGDVVIFEGIQVLYENLGFILRDFGGEILYICPESGIDIDGVKFVPNEIRLLRRIVRDRLFRSSGAEFTLSLWKSVRQNEERNIFPHIKDDCVRVDTTMAYEMNVLKPYLETAIEEISADSKYFSFGQSILEKLSGVNPIGRDAIGKSSLYNEFV